MALANFRKHTTRTTLYRSTASSTGAMLDPNGSMREALYFVTFPPANGTHTRSTAGRTARRVTPQAPMSALIYRTGQQVVTRCFFAVLCPLKVPHHASDCRSVSSAALLPWHSCSKRALPPPLPTWSCAALHWRTMQLTPAVARDVPPAMPQETTRQQEVTCQRTRTSSTCRLRIPTAALSRFPRRPPGDALDAIPVALKFCNSLSAAEARCLGSTRRHHL